MSNDNAQHYDVYEIFRESVRRLAVERIQPKAAELDRTKTLPVESLDAFRLIGLTGLPFPEDLEGQGGDLLTQVIAVEEVSRVCASSGLTLMASWAALDPLLRFGSKALIEEVAPNVVAVEKSPHGVSPIGR